MAILKTTVTSDIKTLSMAGCPGILPEDLSELRTLGILQADAFMAAMDATGGKLETLSRPDAVIEPHQATRLGDRAVAWEKLPQAWREKWVPSSTAPASAAGKKRGFLDGLGGH